MSLPLSSVEESPSSAVGAAKASCTSASFAAAELEVGGWFFLAGIVTFGPTGWFSLLSTKERSGVRVWVSRQSKGGRGLHGETV